MLAHRGEHVRDYPERSVRLGLGHSEVAVRGRCGVSPVGGGALAEGIEPECDPVKLAAKVEMGALDRTDEPDLSAKFVNSRREGFKAF